MANLIIILAMFGVAITGIVIVVVTFTDIADTASVIDSIELTNQAVYAEQGYVTVQVKNGGNTAIDNIYAVLLVTDNAGVNAANCAPGAEQMLITTNLAVVAAAGQVQTIPDLDPGESVTISGSLRDIGDSAVNTGGTALTSAAGLAVATTNNCAGELENRGEYILQVSGTSDGDLISKTISIRTR